MENTIKKLEYREKKFKKILLNIIRQMPNGLTLEDMIVGTGLAKDWIELTLMSLLEDFPCRLKANQKGEILYIFDIPDKNKVKLNFFLKSNRIYKTLQKSLVYIFGEAKRKKDRLLTEKIILNYIKNNQGRIVVAELIQLTGWSIKEAETQAVRLLTNYQGEVVVSKEGIVVYIFEDLATKQKDSSDIIESLKIWERTTPEKQFNKYSEVENQKIQKIAKYLTITSCTIPIIISTGFYQMMTPFLLLGSLIIPSFFGILGLAIPALRKKSIHYHNEKIRLQNVERYILKVIFQKIQTQLNPHQSLQKTLEEVKPQKNYLYWWNPKFDAVMYDIMMMLTCTYNKEAIFRKKANDLEADINVLENGELSYEFERLEEELRIIKNIRLVKWKK